MSGYTKGPWKLNETIDDEGVYVATIEPDLKDDDPYIGNICRFQDCAHIKGIGVPEAKANARLLLASKDMYEALTGVLRAVDIGLVNIRPQDREVFGQLLTEVNAAISKAEGK